MKTLIVTGMSGAGKTRAMQALEDIGYYCVDNLPPRLLFYMLDENDRSGMGMGRDKVAISVDVRSLSTYPGIGTLLRSLKKNEQDTKILFLDADDMVLKKRYKETRRLHPLLQDKAAADLVQALQKERDILRPLYAMADFVLDTSHLSTASQRERLIALFADADYKGMIIEMVAFGFKYGILADADLVFDVRCLPNPFYIEELRKQSGHDPQVRSFVMQSEEAQILFDKIRDYLAYSIPLYIKEGKSRLVIGFGCTGGQHRSLAFAGLMKEHFESKYRGVVLSARDMTQNRYEISSRFEG